MGSSTDLNGNPNVGIYGKEISKSIYDYGNGSAGSLLRTTNMQYQALSGPNSSYYLANNLLSLPYSVQTLDGSGTQRAYTYYDYDGSTLHSSGVTEQKTAGESYPGNQTSAYRWLNGSTVSQSPCSVSVSNGYLITSNAFFDTGEIRTTTDPCGYTTTYTYSASYYGALRTKVTNALSQSITYTYDFNTGAVTSITDPNSQTMTKNYDALTRLTSVSYPDGGSTSYCYTDSGGLTCSQSGAPYAVVVTRAITSSPVLNETSTVIFDGLGRVSQTQLNSDPSGTTYTETIYDALGRKSQVYNPTRCSSITANCASETTWGYTSTNYDALSRATSVIEQDGSTVGTNYSAFPCTTVTDEAGKSRQSCVDGLGRMTSVVEDPGSSGHLNYLTTYAYDALGDLTVVTQNGSPSPSGNARVRTFQYNSLSQITTATNPESGTISYGYDADGDVITKTAPLPNQTGSATVTTTSTYDKLNRLTSKSYMDGNTPDPYTPTVQFAYDGNSLSGCTISPPGVTQTLKIGRSTSMCDGSGATSWLHDAMGRVTEEERAIGAATVSNFIYYNYNLDGSLATLQTPPMKVLNYTYSGAGHATQLVDNTDNINFASNATYAPPGELTGVTLGAPPQRHGFCYQSEQGGECTDTFNGFAVSNAYNQRLQPILLSAATSSGTIFSDCFDFHSAAAITTPSPCSFSASTAGDNGNLYTVVNNTDSTGSRNQSFTYDNLNRIGTAQSAGPQWGETLNIDPWGNLISRGGISSKAYEALDATANTSNQLSGLSYDAAGNTTYDGTNSYVYDAENRAIWTSGNYGYLYIYDGDGQRVEKCAAVSAISGCPTSGTSGTLYWRGAGSDTLAETDLGGNSEEEYLFFNGERIARRDVDSSGATILVHYYFSNHLGSHGVIYDDTGTVCEQDIDYYPYGGEQSDYCGSSGVTQNYKFTGKERDVESGLDNFGARYDSSSLGRFMTPDWAAKPVTVPYAKFGDPQTLNLYSYVENGPVNRIDPDGHRFGSPQLSDVLGTDCGESCPNNAATTAEQKYAAMVAKTEDAAAAAAAAKNGILNIQVIRSDNLSKTGQAHVNAQIADLKADMAKIGVTVNVTSDTTRSNIDLKHIDPSSFDKGAIPYFFVTSQENGSKTSGSGKFGNTVGVVINEFVNGGDKVVATHETLHILRGDIYTNNPTSWGREMHVDWETFKLEHGWTGGMGWLTNAAGNPPNQ